MLELLTLKGNINTTMIGSVYVRYGTLEEVSVLWINIFDEMEMDNAKR